MKAETYEIELLTPCFCAGADQARAEIRAPSIRGELRWWFRILGGTSGQEKEVFGGVHALPGESKKDAARASAVLIRVGAVKNGPRWDPPHVNRNDPISYVWHFAKASAGGVRWTGAGNVPPGSTFTLHIACRRPIPDDSRGLFDKAVEAFVRFGGIGLRVTRGLGGLRARELPETFVEARNAAERLLTPAGIETVWVEKAFASWQEALAHAGELLKFVLRKHESSKSAGPLGSSTHPRQTSAVRFRVLKCGPAEWRLLLLEAPHERVLEMSSRRPEPLIRTLRSRILGFVADVGANRGRGGPHSRR